METVTKEGLAEYKAYIRSVQEAYNATLDPPAPPWANYLMRRWMDEHVHPSHNRDLAWRILRKMWNVSCNRKWYYDKTYTQAARLFYSLKHPVFDASKLP